MSDSVGDNSFRKISSAPTFDVEHGWRVTDTYEGSEEAVKAGMGTFAAQGINGVSYQYNGPIWRAEFQIVPASDQTGLPEVIDQWEFDTDFVQASIWNNPRVRALASTGDTLSIWKKDILKAIEDHKTNAEFAATGVSAQELAIFATVNQGGEGFEYRRITLRRQRTLPITNAQASRPDAVERVYSSAALIAAFGIPSAIAARMPVAPTEAPDYFAWTWKARRDSSVYVAQLGKLQESRDWVFAPWSIVEYVLMI